MTYRVRNILIAVGLAALAGLLTLYYVTSYKSRVDRGRQNVTVIVASKDIPAGTLGSQVVSGHMLSTEQAPRSSVVRGVITNQNQIANQLVLQPIYQGEQVTSQRLGPITEAGIRSQLRGTFRAIQVSGDGNQVLAGTLHAGDHVDVVGVFNIDRGGNGQLKVSRVVIRDVLVLRTSSSGGAAVKVTGPGSGSGSVILRMTDSQSQKLALIYKDGDYWSLELRPGIKDADSPQGVETEWTLLTDGIGPGRLAQALGGGH